MQTKYLLLLALTVLSMSMSGCNYSSRQIYTSKSFTAVAKHHKTIAILPFDVQVELRPKEMRRMTPERHYELELQYGRAVQSALQTHFIKAFDRSTEKIEVQDVNLTNAILQEMDLQPEELYAIPPAELAKELEVDAVITGSLFTEKPLSNVVAAAVAVYTLLYTSDISNGGPTNAGTAAMKIYDGATGDLLWSYEKILSRGLGSDTHTIVRAITRKASKKIPYNKMEYGKDLLSMHKL